MSAKSNSGRWRAMAAADLPGVNALAARIHPSFPEDEAVFAERLRLYPDGCRVFERGSGIEAYVISHPSLHAEPPALNSLLGALPETPSTFYIHDLALRRKCEAQVRQLMWSRGWPRTRWRVDSPVCR